MSEKAVSIGAYVVASGIYTVSGTVPPVLGSPNVATLLTDSIESLLGAKFAVETDPIKGAELIIAHLDKKRKALGI
jgi:carbon-monoxide dehydrogenase catalytic subunit